MFKAVSQADLFHCVVYLSGVPEFIDDVGDPLDDVRPHVRLLLGRRHVVVEVLDLLVQTEILNITPL